MSPAWQAGFITSPLSGEPGGPAPYFRREFTSDGRPWRATLYVTALGIVEPYLNGTRVGDEVLAPGWTSYRHRLNVSRHDVTELIESGANVLGAIVGEGWAAGRLGWEGKRGHYTDQPALFLQLELEYDDRTEVIGTDRAFTTSTGAVLANSLYDGETYDARLEPDGWSRPGFDDGSWSPAEPLEWDLGTLITPTAPPIRRVEELAPVEISTSPSGKTIVDFGQNISGWVRLTVTGEAGRTITLRHAEVLVDGELETETLRTAAATDRYTLCGDGEEVWEPRFTFHGFRYVEVDGYPGELRPEAVSAVVVHSDMTRTGWFETSHELVDRLHANAVWSMRDNFVGVPTDCPQRDERLGWTGDINAFAPTAAFLYDVRGVLGSWLADLAAEQREKGYVPWVVPDVLSTPSPPTALWSDAAVSLPWTLYREYGDLDILRQSYASMTTFIRSVEELLDETGLWSSGFQYGDWLDPDAPMDNPAGGKTDRHLVASAYLCKTTREMAETAALLGEDADAAHFAALAERVREAFRREYVTPAGRVSGETATAYALAIAFGILDADQKVRAGKRLAELVAKAGYRISTGFAGTPLVLHALSDTGHLEEAYLLLLETGCPSFLYPVSMGATTIWERWDSILPDGTVNPSGMTSLNHYALGAVADWLHRVVGGLAPLEPGYRTMSITPRPGGGLTHAAVRHDTMHGGIEVAWRVTGRRMNVEVTIPDGTEAKVTLPLHPDSLVVDIPAGSHSWRYDLPEDRGRRAGYDLDTPLKTLAEDPAVWRNLTEVFAKHFPGVPIDGTAPEAASVSLNKLLEYVPSASDELKTDLVAAIASAERPSRTTLPPSPRRNRTWSD
ncbi:alpha-L-rhamnosidase [Thermomonospora echinospora]|uniref:alpha-L-rhamnosidase n=1 Tax=Thermomonospora echinospora TaxID=1992 RepID=A0A1H6E4Z7_9ACTN|nr:alpha-L-rhamnosidase [Thermomonospora echinospora]SEG92697.1 alpha-L-rhamnosidase [Thermomonospora echinospora]